MASVPPWVCQMSVATPRTHFDPTLPGASDVPYQAPTPTPPHPTHTPHTHTPNTHTTHTHTHLPGAACPRPRVSAAGAPGAGPCAPTSGSCGAAGATTTAGPRSCGCQHEGGGWVGGRVGDAVRRRRCVLVWVRACVEEGKACPVQGMAHHPGRLEARLCELDYQCVPQMT
jgi:hypothetical protein